MANNLSRRDFMRYAAGAGMATVVITSGLDVLDGYAYAAGTVGGGIGSGTLPEQVHLTWGSDASTEMTVSWLSPTAQSLPQLTVTPPGPGTPVVYSAGQVTELTYTDAFAGSNETVYAYHVPLTGLTPGATYGYSVEDADAQTPHAFTSSFTMAQGGRFAYKFTSFGDLATPGAGATYTLADGTTVSSTTYSESQWNAYTAITEVESLAPLFHLMNGDLAYADKEAVPIPNGGSTPSGYVYQPSPEVWRDYGLNTQRSAANRPWMPSIGNHEAELLNTASGHGSDGYASFNTRYLVPANNVTTQAGQSANGNFYAFTVGSILFICLDANDVCYQGSGAYNVALQNATAANGSTVHDYTSTYNRQYTGAFGSPAYPNGPLPAGENAQTVWLQNTLADARTSGGTIDWIVVSMHQCACSSTTDNGSDLGIRQAWLSLFFEYGVDLVLNGHDHCYERTYPLNGFNANTVVNGVSQPAPQGTGLWKGGTVYTDGQGDTQPVASNYQQAVQTLTPVPVAGTPELNGGNPNGATYAWASGLPANTGTVFMTLGGGGTNKRDNAYEDNSNNRSLQAQVTTFTQVRTGGSGYVVNGVAQSPGTKPAADTMESQVWSAMTDTADAYGVAEFSVDPGSPQGTTTLTVNYYHASTVTSGPATYSLYDSFTLVRPRSDSPAAGLPEFPAPAAVVAGTVAAAGAAAYIAHRRHAAAVELEPARLEADRPTD